MPRASFVDVHTLRWDPQLSLDVLDLMRLLFLDGEEPDQRTKLVCIQAPRIADTLVDAVAQERLPVLYGCGEESCGDEVGFPVFASITFSAVFIMSW